MRRQYTDMSLSERRQKYVFSAQVISVDDSNVTLLRKFPNGTAETFRMTCSFASELEPLTDHLDIQQYLTGEHTSLKILGLTPPEYQPKN